MAAIVLGDLSEAIDHDPSSWSHKPDMIEPQSDNERRRAPCKGELAPDRF
jgi:hypothetical protein